jgi:hypothetical protein
VECSPIDFGGCLGTRFFALQFGHAMILPPASTGSRTGVLQNEQLMVNTAGSAGMPAAVGGMVVCIHSGFRGERPTSSSDADLWYFNENAWSCKIV